MRQAQPRHREAQQGWEQGLIGEGLLLEAFEALSPSVVGELGELCKEQAHLGLGECAERDEGEQERVDAFALGGCECVLEVLQERCDWVLFCHVVLFGCYHSGWNLLQAALFCTRPMYPYQVSRGRRHMSRIPRSVPALLPGRRCHRLTLYSLRTLAQRRYN